MRLQPSELQAPIVIIPINGWNQVTERAVRLGLTLSKDITAVHICTEPEDKARFRELWRQNVEQPAEAANTAVPQLKIIDSPYRQVPEPIVDFVNKVANDRPERPVAVIIPQLIEPHWYEYLLHNFYVARLRSRLLAKCNERTVVINTPWHLRDE